MRQLRYNHASNVLTFEYPAEWKGEDITGITLAITDEDGNELLAAQALTLYTATSLNAAAARFSRQITLASGAGSLEGGNPILIEGDEGFERNRVKGYDSSTRVVTLERDLNNVHESGDAVRGLWGTYTLDTTTVATWTAGLVVTLTWTPTGAGLPTTELAQVSKSIVELEGIEKRLARLFPRAHHALTETTDRFADILEEAKNQCIEELELGNMELERVVDQDAVSTMILYKIRLLWTSDGDEKMKDEQALALKQYEEKKAIAQNRVLWLDANQDKVKDDGEETDHAPHFGRGW